MALNTPLCSAFLIKPVHSDHDLETSPVRCSSIRLFRIEEGSGRSVNLARSINAIEEEEEEEEDISN